MKNLEKVDDFFKKMYDLNENNKCIEKELNAKDLINSNRIDLIAKLKYIEYIDNDYKTNFFKELYKETINSFSDGTYNEPGNKSKNSFNKYIETFNNMIIDIRENGFSINKSIVPISKDNIILDGSHRTAVCSYFNKNIPVISFDVDAKKFNLNYFKNKCMEDKYLDYLCLEYSKIKKDIYIFCLWPNCYKTWHEEVEKKLYKKLNVIYEKEINFTYNGFKNFMIQVYKNDSWVGNLSNKYNGIYDKVDKCFDKSKTKFFIVEEKDCKKVLKIKEELRKKINLSNHSIHTTDNYNESIDILNLILNNNSINFLNKAELYKYNKTYKEISDLKEKLNKRKIPFDKIVLDGSIVLSLYGLRENKDIDVIISKQYKDKINNTLDIHNDEVNIYDEQVDNILYNPNNYFYFDGLKYMSLELLEKKKEKMYKIKHNKKDKKDIELINSILVKQNVLKKIYYKIKVLIQKLKLRTKRFIMIILKKIGLYSSFEKTWRKIKRKK